MQEEQNWFQEELKSGSKQLTLEQFKLLTNDLALEDLHTKLQTERSKRIKLFSSLNKTIKKNIDFYTQLADAWKQQAMSIATNSVASAKDY